MGRSAHVPVLLRMGIGPHTLSSSQRLNLPPAPGPVWLVPAAESQLLPKASWGICSPRALSPASLVLSGSLAEGTRLEMWP